MPAPSTMASKHCLAEIAHVHMVQCKSKNMSSDVLIGSDPTAVQQPAFKQRNVNVQSLSNSGEKSFGGSQSEVVAWPSGHAGSGRKKTTAWFLFRDQRLATRPWLMGESKNERRQRIVKEASQEYKHPDFAAEVEKFRSEAKAMNQDYKSDKASGLPSTDRQSLSSSSAGCRRPGLLTLIRPASESGLAVLPTSATGFGAWAAGEMLDKTKNNTMIELVSNCCYYCCCCYYYCCCCSSSSYYCTTQRSLSRAINCKNRTPGQCCFCKSH